MCKASLQYATSCSSKCKIFYHKHDMLTGAVPLLSCSETDFI